MPQTPAEFRAMMNGKRTVKKRRKLLPTSETYAIDWDADSRFSVRESQEPYRPIARKKDIRVSKSI